jgi:RES domain-containing protein
MRVWRLCRKKYAATAFDGEGARLFPGRWHHRGTRIVYTAGSLSLAVLELLVHFDYEDAPRDYVSIALDVPGGVGVETVNVPRLPARWRDIPSAEGLQDVGTAWIEAGSSAILRVPSAIVADEMNYLVNPAHPDFARCRALAPIPFAFDPRLFQSRR